MCLPGLLVTRDPQVGNRKTTKPRLGFCTPAGCTVIPDFTAATGSYILAAPTGADGTPYNYGIWFLDPSGPSASLDLPVLPEGWAYEGWVVGEDGPVSTGIFTNTAAADSDAGGPAAGPNPAPPFPGQDFITPPANLVGQTTVISVEPSPDNSPAPFTLKPLVDEINDTGEGGILQDLTNNAAFKHH